MRLNTARATDILDEANAMLADAKAQGKAALSWELTEAERDALLRASFLHRDVPVYCVSTDGITADKLLGLPVRVVTA